MQAKQIKIAKEVNVLHIEPKSVDRYWTLVEFMLKEGLKYDGHPMSINQLKKFILSGEYQLFMMFGSDDGESYKVFGVFVTIFGISLFKKEENYKENYNKIFKKEDNEFNRKY